MTKLILNPSFKRAFKVIIKRRTELKVKIEAKLRLLAIGKQTQPPPQESV
jgi:hypothetical protein